VGSRVPDVLEPGLDDLGLEFGPIKSVVMYGRSGLGRVKEAGFFIQIGHAQQPIGKKHPVKCC